MSSSMEVKTINNPQYWQNVECLVSSGTRKANKEIGHWEGWEAGKNIFFLKSL